MLQPVLSRLPINPSPRECLCLAIGSLALILTLLFGGRADIRGVSISYPADPAKGITHITLPFESSDDGQTAQFVADLSIGPAIGDPHIFLRPDDCLEWVETMDGRHVDLEAFERGARCFPRSVRLWEYISLPMTGGTIRLGMSNKIGTLHALDAFATVSPGVALAIVSASWLLVFSVVSFAIRRGRRFRSANVRRDLARSMLPLLGVLCYAGLSLAIKGDVSLGYKPLVYCLAVSSVLFLASDATRVTRGTAFEIRPVPIFAGAAVLIYCVSAISFAGDAADPIAIFAAVLTASLCAHAAITPIRPFYNALRYQPRLFAVALTALLCPLVYATLQLPYWYLLYSPTTSAVAAILSAVGVKTSTSFGVRTEEDGRINDYWGYVTSPDFSIQIGNWCGGLEGICFFLFLLSGFVMLDWDRFSKTKHLWALFVGTGLFVIALNILRIAAIFHYAQSLTGFEEGFKEASRAAVETFHSNAGLVLYGLAFGPYLSAIYWYERRSAGRVEARKLRGR